MATIEYQNPKDNPNRETKLKEYLDLLSSSDNLIGSQSSYEAFFYIGKFCRCLLANECAIFLEKKAAQIFIRTLESLYEKRDELKFDDSETSIEIGDAPTSDEKCFKESIFSDTLYSINILCKDLVRRETVLMIAF
jgi:hypothetical protein